MTTPVIPLTVARTEVSRAVAAIRAGQLVAFPTETVYGLGADATNDTAVARIFAVKQRPRFNPLIVHLADLAAAERFAAFDERARRIAAAFWPGPLTLVLPRRAESGLSMLVSAGLDTVALRVPQHPVALTLLRAFGGPIAAPSANPSGRVSPTTAAHVMHDLGEQVAVVLDGGPCLVGIESTIVDLSSAEPIVLRPGGVPIEAVEAALGRVQLGLPGRPRAPGMLRRHYAPSRPVRLEARGVLPGEAWLGFGPACAGATMNLSVSGHLEEAAGNLFAMLRALDRPEFSAIAVAPIPHEGLGRAINDRLQRAAERNATEMDAWDDSRGPAAPCVLPTMDDG